MLRKGIPTITANKAGMKQQVFRNIMATLERPRSCQAQGPISL